MRLEDGAHHRKEVLVMIKYLIHFDDGTETEGYVEDFGHVESLFTDGFMWAIARSSDGKYVCSWDRISEYEEVPVEQAILERGMLQLF